MSFWIVAVLVVLVLALLFLVVIVKPCNQAKIGANHSTVIVDGKIITQNTDMKFAKIDETQEAESDKAKRIVIKTKIADIFITVGNTPKLKARLYGEGNFSDTKPSLLLSEAMGEIEITEKHVGNYFSGKLCLEIIVPNQLYETVEIKTLCGDIYGQIKSEQLQVKTNSGNICLQAEVGNCLYLNTLSGNIDIHLEAFNQLRAQVNTMNGGIKMQLANINRLELITESMNGNVRNSFKDSNNGYPANMSVSTLNGNIMIK